MDLGERDIWNQEELVRDAAVRGFLADELFWSSTRWGSDPHGPGWLSTQYTNAPSGEAAARLVSSVLRCLEDSSPLVRAACVEFFWCCPAHDGGALVETIKTQRDKYKQTPYPFQDEFENALAALVCVVAATSVNYKNDDVVAMLREELELDPTNSGLVSAMAGQDRDRQWMLSQAPRLVAERPGLVKEYLGSSYKRPDRLEFLNAIRDVLAPEVLRAEIQNAIPNEEKASFYLRELGL